MAYRGRTLDTITQVEVLRSFHRVREDLARFEAAGRMVGFVRALSGGDEADRRVFNLLYHGLDTLEGGEAELEALEPAFALKLSVLAGYAPQLDSCMGCGLGTDEFEDYSYFAPTLGGLVCEGCRAGASEAFPLPPGTAEGLKALISYPLREAAVEDKIKDSVRRVVRAHVFAHAPGSSALGASGARRPA
jgi:DNA repair protein RecO (recombination protein O)